jgi:hypothetical protein
MALRMLDGVENSTEISSWSASVYYAKGDQVKHEGEVYVCTGEGTSARWGGPKSAEGSARFALPAEILKLLPATKIPKLLQEKISSLFVIQCLRSRAKKQDWRKEPIFRSLGLRRKRQLFTNMA